MEDKGAVTKSHSDFSINHILNKAGVNLEHNTSPNRDGVNDLNTYSWLQCTRFCPPKVPRIQKKDPPQKRQLGRYPRIPFTNEQIATLEEKFQESPYLSSEEASNLSRRLQLADIKVKIWFQNRRARKRREEMNKNFKEKIPKTEHMEAVLQPSTSSRSSQISTDTNSLLQSTIPQSSTAFVPFMYISPQNILEFKPR
ncbi:homeobox protein ceh-1-like [Diabrotica virgifera virgifera]|uniref:Homeobox domain-containing protein n=1 Tax=Diabrotica virgifera virgifera TaxID=50390 RepID=A0ABM5KG27_DIAVI|nr:homeobox protein ceh-1-like [Diabrotica virgifera virgifera]